MADETPTLRYNPSANRIEVFRDGNWRDLPSFRLANGNAEAPSYSFFGDSDTGFYRIGADQIGISTGGRDRLRINADTVMVADNNRPGTAALSVGSYLQVGLNGGRAVDGPHIRMGASDGVISVPNNLYLNIDDIDSTTTRFFQVGHNRPHLNAAPLFRVREDGETTIYGHLIPSSDKQFSIGTAKRRWDIIHANVLNGTATAAKFADLAERYEADQPYEPGTVVVFGGTAEITQSFRANDSAVAGVISANPGMMLNSDAGQDGSHPYVALAGRVRCRVVGPVQKGDLLVTSLTPGAAMAVKYPTVGTVLAKAMETHRDPSDKYIEVMIFNA